MSESTHSRKVPFTSLRSRPDKTSKPQFSRSNTGDAVVVLAEFARPQIIHWPSNCPEDSRDPEHTRRINETLASYAPLDANAYLAGAPLYMETATTQYESTQGGALVLSRPRPATRDIYFPVRFFQIREEDREEARK